MTPENIPIAESQSVIDQIRSRISSDLKIKLGDLDAHSSIGQFPEWDSLGHITIYFSIQELFGIVIPLENTSNIRSIEDWVRAVKKQLS